MTDTKNNDSEEKLKKREARRMNTVRQNYKINRKLIDRLIGMKKCTMLTNKDWDCAKYPEFGVTKGGQPFCHAPDFLNQCPLFNYYLNHEMIRNRRKITGNENT